MCVCVCDWCECVYECAWYHKTFLVHLSLGNQVVSYCIVLSLLLLLLLLLWRHSENAHREQNRCVARQNVSPCCSRLLNVREIRQTDQRLGHVQKWSMLAQRRNQFRASLFSRPCYWLINWTTLVCDGQMKSTRQSPSYDQNTPKQTHQLFSCWPGTRSQPVKVTLLPCTFDGPV